MKFEINVVLGVLAVLTGAAQAGGQSSVLPPGSASATLPSLTGTSVSPELTEDPEDEAPQWTHNLTGRTEPWKGTTTETPQSDETVLPETETNSVLATDLTVTSSAASTNVPIITATDSDSASSSAAADGLSSPQSGPLTTPLQLSSTTDSTAPLTSVSLATFSSQPARTAQDAASTAPASTAQAGDESFTTATGQTTAHPEASAPGRAPAAGAHQEAAPELNVGDEELKKSHGHARSPLDPLLAGLLSVFIVTTAIVFVALFLKFRQRTNHPEFHRLQDLPMDDLMEDTPLSRYSY